MGKIKMYLEKQSKSENEDIRRDAQDCLAIYEAIQGINPNGEVRSSQWNPLVATIFPKVLCDDRIYQPTAIGRIFLRGIKQNKK